MTEHFCISRFWEVTTTCAIRMLSSSRDVSSTFSSAPWPLQMSWYFNFLPSKRHGTLIKDFQILFYMFINRKTSIFCQHTFLQRCLYFLSLYNIAFTICTQNLKKICSGLLGGGAQTKGRSAVHFSEVDLSVLGRQLGNLSRRLKPLIINKSSFYKVKEAEALDHKEKSNL